MERDGSDSSYQERGQHFNSHAHVERDVSPSAYQPRSEHFNSHAHVERDYVRNGGDKMENISTHTLTWSVTNLQLENATEKIFQLTRSRGA